MPKKSPAKKVSKPAVKPVKAKSKKAATKTTPVLSRRSVASLATPRAYSFDILASENDDFVERTRESLETIRSKRTNRTAGFCAVSEIRQAMLPIRDFFMQHALGMYGFPQNALIDIIGPEGVGKSSLAFLLLGWALQSGCPCYYQETEGKQLPPDRILRMLSQDPKMAVRMLSRIGRDQVHSLPLSVEYFEDWVDSMRGRGSKQGRESMNVPMDTPIIAVVDSWSKLMNSGEAAGFYDAGDHMSEEAKKKYKAVGEGSNLGHAKFAQDWCRRLPYYLVENNVILIIIEHQNEKVSMSQSPAGQKAAPTFTQMSAETSAIFNKTKRGGRAFNQNSAIQLILARKSLAKFPDGKASGIIVRMRVDKNSFGPGGRVIEYEMRNEHRHDTDTYLEPAIQFHDSMAKWFADDKLCGTTVYQKRYTSDEIGVTSVAASEFCAAFHANTALVNRLGQQLKMEGYVDIVDRVLQQIADGDQPTEDPKPTPSVPPLPPTTPPVPPLPPTPPAPPAPPQEATTEEEGEVDEG